MSWLDDIVKYDPIGMAAANSGIGASGSGSDAENYFTALADPGDLFGIQAKAAATTGAEEAALAQQIALAQATEKTTSARDEAQKFLAPLSGLGQEGIDQASFLTDPQAQYDYLQSNPLFAAALENANTQTMNMAAAGGRISAGDTLQQLSNNVLLSASPLIAGQKASIGDLISAGAGVAGSQANIAIGKGTELSNLIQTGGNVAASAALAQSNIQQQQSQNTQNLAMTALSFMSDPRLKEDKVIIGEQNGFKIWAWNWNEKAKELFGLIGQATGVMADEVKEKRPEAIVMRDGYMTVDYNMIGVTHG